MLQNSRIVSNSRVTPYTLLQGRVSQRLARGVPLLHLVALLMDGRACVLFFGAENPARRRGACRKGMKRSKTMRGTGHVEGRCLRDTKARRVRRLHSVTGQRT
jgi:hypothetical protein